MPVAIRAPTSTPTTDESPITRALRARRWPYRRWFQPPAATVGTIASSEVARASICPSPSTTSVGTKRIPPPTPNRPERTPAARPRASARTIVVTSGPHQPGPDADEERGEPVREGG